MKNIKALLLFVTFFSLFPGSKIWAAVSPLAISVATPVQFPAEDFSITGAKLNLLYGRQEEVYGVELSLGGSINTQRFVGIGISGLFNYTTGQTTALGLQFAGLTNVNTGKLNVYGLQAALGANYNKGESHIWGLQLAAANLSAFSTINGVQLGVYNTARKVRGFQIGLINQTESLSGIQIGLLNFHRQGLFSVSPIINIGF